VPVTSPQARAGTGRRHGVGSIKRIGRGRDLLSRLSRLNVFAPLVLTAIVSQLLVSVEYTRPEINERGEQAVVTVTAELVAGPAMATPVVLVV